MYGSYIDYSQIAYDLLYDIEAYIIVLETPTIEKWYLREYSPTNNAATWTTYIRNAKKFETTQAAYDCGNQLHRPYFVEGYDFWA